jgi:hypothetical protein
MKISLSKFYKEITGKTTVNRSTTTGALTRWGVPFEDNSAKADVVDIVHLEGAKATYAAEQAVKEAARASRPPAHGNGHDHGLDLKIDALAQRVELLIESINARASHTDGKVDVVAAKLDSVMNRLSQLKRAR